MKINIEDTLRKDVDLIFDKVVLNKLKDKINELSIALNLNDVGVAFSTNHRNPTNITSM